MKKPTKKFLMEELARLVNENAERQNALELRAELRVANDKLFTIKESCESHIQNALDQQIHADKTEEYHLAQGKKILAERILPLCQ